MTAFLQSILEYPMQSEVILGERYGYGFSNSGRDGYDYPTGGSGRILPISFHKFDDVDPYQVYTDYLNGPNTTEIKNKQEL
ncbi:hypothetical protein ANCCEY_11397 [Ancylostoma ceylanicum]|uniref:Uncharacterized protein n=1 Tax=Ancylostoma ceylanicum TaxID=53326 RepID=A0A0D6LHX2_9BILA|nr:hypothetical protein ANCCEY_11397 [Ancylostoma ceylanicum]